MKMMRILIVEDDGVRSKILELSLEKGGFATVMAQTGKQGIDFLKSIPDIQLIIADIMM